MAAPKGNNNNPNGRPKGTPNKTTAAVREVIARFADEMAPSFCQWIKETAAAGNPEKAADLYLKALEYHIPKLQRSTIEGPDGGPVQVSATVTFVRPE